jgi:hypothetical protein
LTCCDLLLFFFEGDRVEGDRWKERRTHPHMNLNVQFTAGRSQPMLERGKETGKEIVKKIITNIGGRKGRNKGIT